MVKIKASRHVCLLKEALMAMAMGKKGAVLFAVQAASVGQHLRVRLRTQWKTYQMAEGATAWRGHAPAWRKIFDSMAKNVRQGGENNRQTGENDRQTGEHSLPDCRAKSARL
jgi:hypothetical protein